MLLDREVAILKREEVAILLGHHGENLFFVSILFARLIIPKNEYVARY